VRPGQTVLVADPAGGAEIEGRVISVDPNASGATQSFLAKAELNTRDGRFRNGERVRTQLLFSAQPGLAIPALAVTRTSGKTFVFVVGSLQELAAQPGNVQLEALKALPPSTRFAIQTPVSLGPLQGNHYPVKRGLTAGQSVIVSNLFSLRHGAPVTVR
jgi:membrane fusion protein (multidrug efflux system)